MHVRRCVDSISVRCDTTLIHEGESPRQVLVLSGGLLEATTTLGNPPELMLPGATFGEAAVLSHTPYTRTLTAREHSQLLVIEARAFLDVVYRFPSVSARLARSFAGSLAASDRRVYERPATSTRRRDVACSRMDPQRRT
jgi:CRP-like cAMP-binding protein